MGVSHISKENVPISVWRSASYDTLFRSGPKISGSGIMKEAFKFRWIINQISYVRTWTIFEQRKLFPFPLLRLTIEMCLCLMSRIELSMRDNRKPMIWSYVTRGNLCCDNVIWVCGERVAPPLRKHSEIGFTEITLKWGGSELIFHLLHLFILLSC